MGLAHHNEFIFIASEYDYICHYVDYFNSDSLEVYLNLTGASGDIFDIAYDSGNIWLAWDSSSQPVRMYDTGGTVIDYLPGSLIPQATGLTLDPAGYLWVSNNDSDEIYQVDLDTALDRSTWGWIKASLQ